MRVCAFLCVLCVFFCQNGAKLQRIVQKCAKKNAPCSYPPFLCHQKGKTLQKCGIPCLCLTSKEKKIRAHTPTIRERPPGLLQHVLTVLVFWSWVLPLTRLAPSSRSLRLCLWASILLYGPVDIAWDLLPAAPPPPVQKRDAQHMFLQHRGAHADTSAKISQS